VLRQPVLQGRIVEVLDGKAAEIDLVAHLHLVAAVDEDRCLVAHDDRDAGRAGEAGEVSEPAVMWRAILALVLVKARHDVAVEPLVGELAAQRFNAAGRVQPVGRCHVVCP
jgi:hypothetical protein